MKTFHSIVLSLLMFCSCQQDEVKNESPYYFKCKINGASYSITGETDTYAILKTPETYWIYGTEVASGKDMYIRIPVNQGLGTIAMKGTTQGSFLDTDKSNYHTNFNSGSGEITISERSTTTLKGKFSFIANTFSSPIKRLTVTEGEFYVLIK